MVPRENWAQNPADPEKMTTSRDQFSIISLHHTGSKDTPESVEELHRWQVSPAEKIARRLSGAQSYDGQGDISYHFMIDANGKVYEGRSLDYVGASVRSYNQKNIGIAFLGDYSTKSLNGKQINAAVTLIDRLNLRYGNHSRNALHGSLTIYTHADFDSAKRAELKGAQPQVQAIKAATANHWKED